MPARALYDYEIIGYAKKLKIPHFRGVFMRDTLPARPNKNESIIMNMDNSKNSGTHWVCYVKKGNIVNYYDSYGDLRPPQELIIYLGKQCTIFYNVHRDQKFNESSCGRYCLEFLYKINNEI